MYQCGSLDRRPGSSGDLIDPVRMGADEFKFAAHLSHPCTRATEPLLYRFANGSGRCAVRDRPCLGDQRTGATAI